ncbi:MAG: proton-conducting transporter membrane subunit [Exilispira sp.]
MIDIFIMISFFIVIIILFLRNNTVNYLLLVFYSIFQIFFVLLISKAFFSNDSYNRYFSILKYQYLYKYFYVDSYSIFFLIITSILFLISSIASINKIIFMKEKNFSLYSAFLILFFVSLFGVILSQNILVLWIFIEATTLSGGVLIYQDKSRHSLEAAWKYLFVCSIGIAISFVGIIFLSLAFQTNSLSFSDLYLLKDVANKFWLELGFGFILIGFGTKAGLAPTHAWLPDAHSEAPSQVSALLSGALLNTALLGIIRILNILPDDVMKTGKQYLLFMGVLSVIISAIYMLKSKNYKRLFAYSSIENIGLIAIGLSLNGLASIASYLLIISHSLTKSSLFITSGVIKDIYHTTEIKKTSNLMIISPLSSIVLISGFLSICGFPLFLSFMAELNLINYLISNNMWLLLIILLFFLLIILYSIAKIIFYIVFNIKEDSSASELLRIKEKKLKLVNNIQIISALILIILTLILGIYLPSQLNNFISTLVNI